MTQEKAVEAVRQLPQEFDLDDLIERLIVIDKVEKGLQQLDEDQTKSHEEAEQIIKSWRK